MIEVGVVSKLVALTDHDDEVIKVNSIWALMVCGVGVVSVL